MLEQKPEQQFIPLTREQVLAILNSEVRNKIYKNADQFFADFGSNGVEMINIDFDNEGVGIMQVVMSDTDLGECTIEINLSKINEQLKLIRDLKMDIKTEDFILSCFSHEVVHAYGYLKRVENDGLINIQAGVDYRLARLDSFNGSVKVDVTKLWREHILFSGSFINELLTDYAGEQFVVDQTDSSRNPVKYFGGYSHEKAYGSFLVEFVELVARLRNLKTSEIFTEFWFSYSQGELLDSKILFYSKLPVDLSEEDKNFFYKVLTAGYAEVFDPKFVVEIKLELVRMRAKYFKK